MNTSLPIKYPLKNCMIKCNVALLLFIFFSVSFVNFAEAHDLSSQEKVLYLVNYDRVADSAPEYDSGDDNVDIRHDGTETFGTVLKTITIQAKATYPLDYAYFRPLTRAPPKVFI
jgi:hypothetical protein